MNSSAGRRRDDIESHHPRRILVTGAGGFIGSCVRDAFARAGDHVFSTRERNPGRRITVDLTTPGRAARLVDRVAPDIVVHAAAITSIAECDADPARARRVNTDATEELARATRNRRHARGRGHGRRFVFFSTDQVFDGTAPPYSESDVVSPLHLYGETKAEAEARLAGHPGVTILRPALVFGRSPSGRRSASESILAALRDGTTPRLFTDEYRTPVSVRHIVQVVSRLTQTNVSKTMASEADGIFHVGGIDRVSRFEFGDAVRRAFGIEGVLHAARMTDVFAAGTRPRDLSLDITRVADRVGPPHRLEAELAHLTRAVSDIQSSPSIDCPTQEE